MMETKKEKKKQPNQHCSLLENSMIFLQRMYEHHNICVQCITNAVVAGGFFKWCVS